MYRIIFFLNILIPLFVYAEIPADVSFIVIDLKYNLNDGVKIYEIQQGLGCAFEGVEFIEGHKNAFVKIFNKFVSLYHKRHWYEKKKKKNITREFTTVFDKSILWNELGSFKSVLSDKQAKKYAQMSVANRSSITDYHGLVVCHYNSMDIGTIKKVSGLMILNRAFFPAFGSSPYTDKLQISNLMSSHEELAEIKPVWNAYSKGYSQELVNQIKEDFESDLLVIKPRTGLQGRGIIILNKEDLEDTLAYIFSGKSNLKKDPDKSYNWWAKDRHDNFIVEEFIESDPVYAPHLSDDLYDGTMRVPIVLTYDRGQIQVHFLYMWWKLP